MPFTGCRLCCVQIRSPQPICPLATATRHNPQQNISGLCCALHKRHEMLHRAERRTATTKTVRETEAEAVAFVVGKTIGLQTNRASADYIHLYHGNAALLTESLEVIQKTSAVILSALEKPAAEATEEPETDMAQAS